MRKEDQYWAARQSVRLWPVQGPDLSEAVRTFMEERLLVDPDRVTSYAITVRKTQGRPREGVEHEVTVFFHNIADRDEVKAAARNLNPGEKCGVNIEVPHHLRGNYRVLQDLAFRLKKKGSLRRNIRFNDDALDLEMSFSLNNGPWQTVLPAEARATYKENERRNSVSFQDLNEMISGPDISPADNNTNTDRNANKQTQDYPSLSVLNAKLLP